MEVFIFSVSCSTVVPVTLDLFRQQKLPSLTFYNGLFFCTMDTKCTMDTQGHYSETSVDIFFNSDGSSLRSLTYLSHYR